MARTFTDKQGNLRQVGTGKILKAAPKKLPAQEAGSRGPTTRPSGSVKPKPIGGKGNEAGGFPKRTKTKPKSKAIKGKTTWTDKQGQIRYVGGGLVNAPAPPAAGQSNVGGGPADPTIPLAEAPEQTIQQQVSDLLKGYDSEAQRIANYSAGEKTQDVRLGAFYDQRLGSMQQGSADPVTQQYLSEAQRAGMAQTQELNHMNSQRTQEELRGIGSEREQARVQLTRELMAEKANQEAAGQELALKMMVAEQELGLDVSKLQLAQDRLSVDASYKDGLLQQGDARINATLRGQDMTAKNRAVARKAAAEKVATDKKGKQREGLLKIKADSTSTPQPWRAAHWELAKQIGADRAAIIASGWFPDSISGSKPARIKALLRNRGVSARVQKQIIDGQWGKGTFDRIGKKSDRKIISQFGRPAGPNTTIANP